MAEPSDADVAMPSTSTTAAAIAAFCEESVPPQDIQQLTMLQAQIHHHLKTSNGEIAAYNEFSAEEHARLVGRFAKHAVTLQAVHTNLLTVFKRTRTLRSRLLAAHPELAEAAAAVDAAREAEIERGRIAVPTAAPCTDRVPAAAATSAPVEHVEPPIEQLTSLRVDEATTSSFLPTPNGPLGRRARVGLLHGGCSNPSIFRQQLSILLAHVGDGHFEWVDLAGALRSEEVRFDERGVGNMRVMRRAFGDDQPLFEHAVTCYDPDGRFYYERLDEAVATLEDQMRESKPIDALVGFSQGANLATILSARACRGCDGSPPPFRALVLLENDPPAWPLRNAPSLLRAEEPLPTPALLVGGSADSPKTEAVGRLYANPAHARHADGHRPLPKDPERCAAFVEEVGAFLRLRLGVA